MLSQKLEATAERVGAALGARIARLPRSEIRNAMAHAAAGGKRLRAFLVLESGRLHGVEVEHAAVAVEAMHAYSLVHDDLPAMDDDDLRRGQPTVHVKWDEATAVLAGDALQALAFEAAALCGSAELVAGLARAAGAAGMVLGQAEDIAAETASEPLNLSAIEGLQARKTGALFEWSATVGPVLTDGDPAPMRRYAQALGLAFQIADDILDVEGDTLKAGKRLNKDAAAGKATFVSLLGLEAARGRAEALSDAAVAALEPYGREAEPLAALARFVIDRES